MNHECTWSCYDWLLLDEFEVNEGRSDDSGFWTSTCCYKEHSNRCVGTSAAYTQLRHPGQIIPIPGDTSTRRAPSRSSVYASLISISSIFSIGMCSSLSNSCSSIFRVLFRLVAAFWDSSSIDADLTVVSCCCRAIACSWPTIVILNPTKVYFIIQ